MTGITVFVKVDGGNNEIREWSSDSVILIMERKLYLRQAAYEERKKGKTIQKVSKDLGVSVGFVSKWKHRGDRNEGFHDDERPGRPRKVPADLEPEEKRLLKRKRSGSAPKVAKVLKTEHGIDISPRQVRTHAKEMGLKSRVRPKKPRLYKGDKARRLAFAKKRREKGFWKKVWWSDEKAFVLHNEPRRQWVETMDEVEPRGKDLVEQSVRVWAAVSDQGWTEIYQIKPQWNADDYIDFLKKKGIPDITQKAGGDFVFEHDGDGAHTSKKVVKYLHEEGIQVLDGPPARSPDIPPIENEWANLVRRLENRNIKKKPGLWKVIKEEWRNMAMEDDRNFSESISKRLKEIIKAQGGMTRH